MFRRGLHKFRGREPGDSIVILEGLQYGNRFMSACRADQTEDELCSLRDGTFAYKVLGYASSSAEAQRMLYGRSFQA